MGRLTEYTGHGYVAYDPIDTKYDFSEINLQKLIDKLAHYEDLEEQGRLVVLQDRKSRTLLSKVLLNSDTCPRELGMKEIEPCFPDVDCEACWEAALESRK
jgi:hypothetical protein